MKKFIIIISVFLYCSCVYSQTDLAANSQVFGIWKKSASPYCIKGNISVPKDSTLYIEPGVSVRFDGKFMLSVFGNIKAIGKKGDTIRFFPQDTTNRWRGVRVYGRNQNKDSSTFSYCVFEYAGPKLSNFENALKLTRGNYLVNNCVFRYNTSNLSSSSFLCDSNLSMTLKDCHFYKNRSINTNPGLNYGIYGPVGVSGNVLVKGCKFELNYVRNPYYSLDNYAVSGDGSGGILAVTDNSVFNSNIVVENCEFIRNTAACKGSAIHIYLVNSGVLKVRNCKFIENVSGRFGAITFNVGSTKKSNAKIVIEASEFIGNKAANSYTYNEAAAIGLLRFSSNDSLIIRNNIFEKNIGGNAVYVFAAVGDKLLFVINNIFRNNYSGCLMSPNDCQLYSIGNLYYNNLYSVYLEGKSQDNQFYSINDLYAYNGFKVDTLWLDQQNMYSASGNYYKFTGAVENDVTTSGVFRNCIFWGNRMINGNIVHLRGSDVKFQEISNCIMQGNTDSTIAWVSDIAAPKPSSMVLNKGNIITDNPLFVNPPSDFGPDVNTSNVDFHLLNNCTKLSPAYNAGLNNAVSTWNGIRDRDNKQRIICDTIDIGPYEMNPKVKNFKIVKETRDSLICPNSGFTLSIENSCASGISFQWQKLQNTIWTNINAANQNKYSSFTPDTGYFRAIVKQNDCNISDTGNIARIMQLPGAVPYLGKDTSLMENQSIVLNPGNFKAYKWQDGSADSSLTISGQNAGLGTKTYSVIVENQFGCKASDSIKVSFEKNSSLKYLLNQGWKIYPNPSNDFVNISSPDQAFFRWQLYDDLGRLILEGNAESACQINLKELRSGIYNIKIISSKNEVSLRLIKM